MADDASEPDDPQDDIKRKFREALERKRGQQADSGGARAGANTGKLHGRHGPARSRRAFRRKSG